MLKWPATDFEDKEINSLVEIAHNKNTGFLTRIADHNTKYRTTTSSMRTSEKQLSSVNCAKIKKKDSTPEFTLKITWSDSTSCERLRTYQNISDFMRILALITPDSEEKFPQLRDPQKFLGIAPLRGDKKKSELDQFFQNLISALPNEVLNHGNFLSFFEISSANELKTKYSAILEDAQTKKESQKRNQTGFSANKDEVEEKYSSLQLIKNNFSTLPVPEIYQVPEDLRKVDVITNDDVTVSPSFGSEPENKKPPNKEGNYWVIKDYKKKCNDEIDVEGGNTVIVLEKPSNGNWLVQSKETEKKGWIPREVLFPQRDALSLENNDLEFVAVQSYTAINTNELSIETGDRIKVLSGPDTGWWLIKVGDKEGRIPGSYIGVLSTKEFQLNEIHNQGKHQTYETIEDLYSRVEKLKIVKKGNISPLTSVDRLPSYENIPKAASDLNAEHPVAISNQCIQEVYCDVTDLKKNFHNIKSDSLPRQPKIDVEKVKKRIPSDEFMNHMVSYDQAASKNLQHGPSQSSIYCNVVNGRLNSDEAYEPYNNLVGIMTNVDIHKDLMNNKFKDTPNNFTKINNLSNPENNNQFINSSLKCTFTSKISPHSPPCVPCKPLNPHIHNKPQLIPKPEVSKPSLKPGNQLGLLSIQKPKPVIPAKPKDRNFLKGRNSAGLEEVKDKYQVYAFPKPKAEELLKLGIRGAYLFTSYEGSTVLSIFDGTKVRHFNIEKESTGELTIGSSSFNSLPEIVDYFKCHPLARNANGDQLKLSKQLRIQ